MLSRFKSVFCLEYEIVPIAIVVNPIHLTPKSPYVISRYTANLKLKNHTFDVKFKKGN